MANSWSSAQLNAIYSSGGRELVSAAAGSGKTSVLVERVIEKITNKETPIDIDKLLIVTFSKAATAEMKDRISKRIRELILENPNDYNLRKQQMLVSSANISTIHSFCSKLMRENFEVLNISPNLRIAEENELATIYENAYLETLETYLNKDDEEFIELLDTISKGRDDYLFKNTVFKIQTHFESLPFPEKWMRDTLLKYSELNPVKSEFGKVVLNYTQDLISYAIYLIDTVTKYINEHSGFPDEYKNIIENEKSQLDVIYSKLKEGDWDDLRNAIVGFSFDRLPAKGYSCKVIDREIAKNLRNEVKSIIKDKLASAFFTIDKTTFEKDAEKLYKKASKLFDFVKAYLDCCKTKKLEKNLVTYSDLEHFAVELLVNENGEFTEKAKQISELFEEILVDEYQDTNLTQDLIFKAVSKDMNNIFMVGDAKQSIYRFRQAMPDIFVGYKNEFCEYNKENPKFPAKITLNDNYRSRKGVTEGINFIFENVMSEKVGDVYYNDDEKLNFKATYPDVEYPSIEIDIVDTSCFDEDENKHMLEARVVANTIKKMVDSGYLVTDKETRQLRPAKYSDFCVLLRTLKGKGLTYQSALIEQNIPAWVKSGENSLKSKEVITILSFLKAINNPTSDIDVAGTMNSAMFDFTIDDIAKIKKEYPERSLYLALCEEVQNNEKVAKFISIFNRFRELSVILPVHKLVLKIYEETDLISIVSSMNDGETREANLMLFVNFINKYETSGYLGLSAILRLISSIDETEKGLPKASILSENANVVKINSIHSSKGLEYPIVIVADNSKGFNTQDANDKEIFHESLGFACKVRENENRIEYETLQRMAISLKCKQEMISEEMRVFYVALTRAKEKLILTCNVDGWHNKLNTVAKKIMLNDTISPVSVFNANSTADWLIMALLKHPICKERLYESAISAIKTECYGKILNNYYNELQDKSEKSKVLCSECKSKLIDKDFDDFFKSFPKFICKNCKIKFDEKVQDEIDKNYFIEQVPLKSDSNKWEVNVITSLPQIESISDNDTTSLDKSFELDKQKCKDIQSKLYEKLNYSYPYKTATVLPSKLAVSQIAKGNNGTKTLKRPDFMKEQGLTGAEKGNAVHKFMQFADYEKASKNPQDEINRMVELEFISKAEGEAVLPKKVEAFFTSNIGKRVLLADKVYRELDFFDAISPTDAFPDMQNITSDENIVIQGIADCVILEGEHLTIIDYKTDKVKTADELIARYSKQLELYKKSISKRLLKTDISCVIYSFELDKEISL